MTALFSTSHASKLISHNTVEFRAGKLQLDGTTVTADKRKGKFKLQFNADNLLQLTWTDRNTNTVEDDFMIMPDEVEFVKIKQCTTGRVFLLKWKDHGRRLFFWLQEPDSAKDESLLKRVADLPSQPAVGRERSGIPSNFIEDLTRLHGAGTSGGRSPQDLYELFRAMSSPGMSVLLPQGEGAAAAFASALNGLSSTGSNVDNESRSSVLSTGDTDNTATTGTASSASSAIVSQSLASYRAALKEALRLARKNNKATSGKMPQGSADRPKPTDGKCDRPDFSRALSWQNLSWFFCEHPEELESLRQLLPEGRPYTNNEVINSLQCPQLGHAKREIAYIIESGQFGTIAHQFGLRDDAIDRALAQGDLIQFCKGLDAMLSRKDAPNEADNAKPEEKRADSGDDTAMED